MRFALRPLAAVVLVLLALAGGAVAVRSQSPSPAILVVTNPAGPNPFGGYLAEMLRLEGITAFGTATVGAVTAPALASASLVVLGETTLTAGQAALFVDYVNGGGRLVAMRPDPQLYGVLGIAAAAGTTANGYVLIDQGGPGAGLQAVTLPFKGTAAHYTLAGATEVARLYATRTDPTARPAVVRTARTAAWAFDLARSTVVTRQGDPALAGAERDGVAPVRTTDVFFGQIDLERVETPHADVQVRLFSRVITALLADALPLPRLWYFPGTARTLLVPTADAHTFTASSYTQLVNAVEGAGGRLTIYVPEDNPTLSGAAIGALRAAGHEVSMHPTVNGTMAQAYQDNATWFTSTLGVAPQATTRHHLVQWQGWTDPVAVMPSFGVRLDTSYYAWGPAMYHPTVQSQAHGYITGSGLPMRFVDASGTVLPVYQQATALVDEQLTLQAGGIWAEGLSPAQALAVGRGLIDASQAGGHSAVTANFHVDYYPFDEVRPWVDGTLAYAQAQQVPIWTAERWLRFTEARAATTMSNLAWSAGSRQLTFGIAVPAGAEPLTLLVPASFGGFALSLSRIDAVSVPGTAVTINGQALVALPVAPAGGGTRQVQIRYADPATLPAVSLNDASVTEGNAGQVSGTLTASLSAAYDIPVTVDYAVTGGTATPGVDFQPAAGTLTFPAGVTTRPVPVTVLADLLDEPDETVVVTLSNPIGLRLGDAAGALTIVDDDVPPTAVPDSYGTGFETPLSVGPPGVLANDQAFGVPGLVAELVTPPGFGSVTLASDGSFQYTPEAEFGGPDSFTYRARTISGPGAPATVTVDVQQPTVVQRPRELRVFALEGQRLTLRWTPPRAGPRPERYLVEGGITPGQTLAVIDAGPWPVVTVDAPVGSFVVRVKSVGGGVTTAPSEEIPVHVGVPVAPSAPADLLAAVAGQTLGLSWRNTFGGGAPLGLLLDASGAAVGTLPLAAGEATAFGGVPPGTYTVALRAANAAGTSSASSSLTFTVPAACSGAPQPPRALLATVVGRTVSLYWEPPATGTAVSGYLLDVAGLGSIPLGGRTLQASVPPGTYVVAMRAVNACGAGAPTATQSIVVP